MKQTILLLALAGLSFLPASAQRIKAAGAAPDLIQVGNEITNGMMWPEENAYGNQVTEGWLCRGLFDNRTGQALPAMKELGEYK
jgi:arabinogalactan endo-1,4-beta-galactosidase